MPAIADLVQAVVSLIPLLAIGAFLAWAIMVFLTARRLAHPPRRGYGSQVARGLPGDPSELARPLDFREWTLKQFYNAPVWEITGENPDGPVLIFTHGWGHARHDILERLDAVRDLVSAVVAWDLPAHGDHPGRRSMLGASEWLGVEQLISKMHCEDLDAKEEELEALGDWDDLDDDFDRHPEPGSPRIILWGWSMGAGISIEAATEAPNRVSGVIAEAAYALPITPARNVLRLARLPHRLTLRPALFLLGLSRAKGPTWVGFNRRDLASDLKQPLLVLHGSEDEVSPVEDGRAIAAAAPDATLIEIESAHHRDLWTDPHASESARAVRDFIATIAAAGPHTTIHS